jgi:hypothetical protein
MIQALGSPPDLLPKRVLCPGRKPNGTGVNSESISCHPIDPITTRFPNGPCTQLRGAARTKMASLEDRKAAQLEAQTAARDPYPNTYRAARVLGSRSKKINLLVFCRSRQQRALVSLPANPPSSQSERGYRVNRTDGTRACKAHTLNH